MGLVNWQIDCRFALMATLFFMTLAGQVFAQTDETLNFQVDRSSVPQLSFNELTFILPVGVISGAEVTVGDVAIPHDYESSVGELIFTTDASQFQVVLNDADPNSIGAIRKASLKHNSKWAFSIGLDDNTGIKPTIEMMDSYGYKGTLFLIANIVDDVRQQDWIVDKPDLINYLSNGWSLGNHTWDHECDGSGDLNPTIVNGYDRLSEVIEDSALPDYRLTAFAAPCFTSEYHDYILNHRDTNLNDVQFNESGGDYRISVDHVGQDDFWLVDRFVQAFNFDRRIGRDATIGWDSASVINEIDWISTHARNNLHLWYNTLAHGGSEATIEAVVQHIDNNYGTSGTNEVWFAPADQIYSYLLVRENTIVTNETATTIAPDSFELVQGILAIGSVTDLADSDDSDLSVRRSSTQVSGVVTVELTSTSPVSTPNQIGFSLEGSGFFRTNVIQEMLLFDFVAQEFVVIDSREMARFDDQSASAFATGNLARFVEPGSDELKARLRFTSNVPRQRFTINLDRAVWEIR